MATIVLHRQTFAGGNIKGARCEENAGKSIQNDRSYTTKIMLISYKMWEYLVIFGNILSNLR